MTALTVANCALNPTMTGDHNDMELTKYHSQLQKKVIAGNLDAVDHMVLLGLPWRSELTPATATPLHVAIKEKKVELVKALVRIQSLIEEQDRFGTAPIHLACRLGLDDIVRILIERGTDINALDKGECTPLYHAVTTNSIQCARLLIGAGCDLDAETFELMTPMDHAVQYNSQDMVALLLRAGCRTSKLRGHIYYRDHSSNSLFCTLWDKGAMDNMRLFLDCGYTLDKLQRTSLKQTCTQLVSHETERKTLKMLAEYFDKPRTLTGLCRQSIRQVLMVTRSLNHTPMDTMICKLPVPKVIKQFLMLKEPQTVAPVLENQNSLAD